MMGWIGITGLLLSTAGVLTPEPALIQKIDESGRCAVLSQMPKQRLMERPAIAPGPPPVLSFKLYEDAKHHRFGNVDVMLDDAGH